MVLMGDRMLYITKNSIKKSQSRISSMGGFSRTYTEVRETIYNALRERKGLHMCQ